MDDLPNNADEIRRRMGEIRRDLRREMKGMAANVNAMTDWRQYVRLYPWAALGVAVAVGYLVVPRRYKLLTNGLSSHDLSKIDVLVKSLTREKQGGPVARVFQLLARTALGAAEAYAIQYVKKSLAGAPSTSRGTGDGAAYRGDFREPGIGG